MRRPFVGGNWKMNGSLGLVSSFAKELEKDMMLAATDADVVVFPPFPLIPAAVASFAAIKAAVGGQNCHTLVSGAFTGEVSAAMLRELGAAWVLIGHSERRTLFGEGKEKGLLDAKVRAAQTAGLGVVFCVGEGAEERAADATFSIIQRQLEEIIDTVSSSASTGLVIAYEPVWAIGTGLVATPQQAQQVHCFIRRMLVDRVSVDFAAQCRIIYGGSVSCSNAATLAEQPDVDGFLVGGASLKPSDFGVIVAAAAARAHRS